MNHCKGKIRTHAARQVCHFLLARLFSAVVEHYFKSCNPSDYYLFSKWRRQRSISGVDPRFLPTCNFSFSSVWSVQPLPVILLVRVTLATTVVVSVGKSRPHGVALHCSRGGNDPPWEHMWHRAQAAWQRRLGKGFNEERLSFFNFFWFNTPHWPKNQIL